MPGPGRPFRAENGCWPSGDAVFLCSVEGVAAELDRPQQDTLIAYVDAHKDQFGVEPICTVLTEAGAKIAPSTYYAHHARPPSKLHYRRCRPR